MWHAAAPAQALEHRTQRLDRQDEAGSAGAPLPARIAARRLGRGELSLHDPHQLAARVERRRAAVAGVDGVGELQERLVRLPVAIRDVADRLGGLCAIRGAERDDPAPHVAVAHVAEAERGQAHRRDPQQGDVEDRIEADHLGLGLQAIGGAHDHALGAHHHTGGGEDLALCHRHARADASAGAAFDRSAGRLRDGALGEHRHHRGTRSARDLIHVGLERRQGALGDRRTRP